MLQRDVARPSYQTVGFTITTFLLSNSTAWQLAKMIHISTYVKLSPETSRTSTCTWRQLSADVRYGKQCVGIHSRGIRARMTKWVVSAAQPHRGCLVDHFPSVHHVPQLEEQVLQPSHVATWPTTNGGRSASLCSTRWTQLQRAAHTGKEMTGTDLETMWPPRASKRSSQTSGTPLRHACRHCRTSAMHACRTSLPASHPAPPFGSQGS